MSGKVNSFHEAVRTRPGMYIGRLGPAGFGYLVSELIRDFAADLQAKEAHVRIDIKGKVTIKFPEINCTQADLYTLIKNGRMSRSSSFWRTSLAIIPPLSKATTLKIGSTKYTVSRNAKLNPHFESDTAKAISRFEITFQPDAGILKAKAPEILTLCARLHELTVVCPGLKITYRDDNTKPFTQMVWHTPEGIRTLLAPARNMFYEKKLEGGFSFNEKGLRGEVYWLCANGGCDPIYSFANGERTVKGGSHVKGCVQGILDALKDLVKGNGEKYDFSVSRAIRHQCLVVSVWGNGLSYAGSTKECLEHKPTNQILRKLVGAHMEQLCASNPKDAIQLTYRLQKWNLAEMYPELYSGKSRKKKK